jgi:hypothetical protein
MKGGEFLGQLGDCQILRRLVLHLVDYDDDDYYYNYLLVALFLIQVYLGSKFCSSVLEIVDLRVPSL